MRDASWPPAGGEVEEEAPLVSSCRSSPPPSKSAMVKLRRGCARRRAGSGGVSVCLVGEGRSRLPRPACSVSIGLCVDDEGVSGGGGGGGCCCC
ncbi:hypothetical protein E2C01_093728 [Portunus trituberculatus]|uniref:Uncharacterized protein n=1 Tax=Portunus trituberculatus TaxID=210409 RepID=A0A5B7JJW8_PORTR|nr:hypothetical protein [Portunus trituberculatus]